MDKLEPLEDCIKEAIGAINHFITEDTGISHTQAEIADVLKRYFVLNEIREQIDMIRELDE